MKIGTGEYCKGLVPRDLEECYSGRVSGENVLGPTLKLAGGVSLILTALFLGFLASNRLV